MPSDRKLKRKIERYERRLQRLLKRKRSRSRSPAIISDNSDSDVAPPSPVPEVILHNTEDEHDSQSDNLNPAFKEALGLEYASQNKFEGNIKNEIAIRWNHILLNGLEKEEKEELLKKYKLPENCTLLEAPVLNEEVKNIMTESAKTRDRSLELVQHQLGLATGIVGQVMTNIIKNSKVDKVQLVKNLADASKLLNDIHYHNTKTRRILIAPLLDKNFISLIDKCHRDNHLYGMDLATKIKTSQDLKKASLQIKKSIPKPTVTKTISKNKTVNKYGPPQPYQGQQTRGAAPRGGPKNRAPQPLSHRPAPRQPRPERFAPRSSHQRR